MKATFILKDFSEVFYNGGGALVQQGFLSMSDSEKWDKLQKLKNDGRVSIKIGNGSFRDAVELNQLIRTSGPKSFKLEPRKGYKLATFEF